MISVRGSLAAFENSASALKVIPGAITPPKYSPRWEKDEENRPRITESFWGPGGIERIQAETGGWPHLVQLVAETAVDLINDEKAKELDEGLLERAIAEAVGRGHNVLSELVERECQEVGEWDYLAGFRGAEVQAEPGDERRFHADTV